MNAQLPSSGMYSTKTGHIVINGTIDTATIIGQSNDLLIILDCMNAEMNATIDINTISTGVPVFDSLLSTSTATAYFKGKNTVDIVKTDVDPPFDFDIRGDLILNNISRPMKIKAAMNYIPDDENAGLLSGTLAISLRDFNLKEFMPNFSDLLVIHFTQVILRKVCE